MPTLLEDVALRKLAAARAQVEETMRTPALMQEALMLVADSPLGRDYFPEVGWRVLWHNLHAPFSNGQVQVLVAADDDQEPEVRLRLLVAYTPQDGGFAVGIVDEDYDGPDWQNHVQIVQGPAEVGLWVERALAAKRPAAQFESITVVPDES